LKKDILLIDGIIDLNILPKDGKVSLQSIKELSNRAYRNGVVGYMFSQIKPRIDSDEKVTLLESISSKIDDTELFISISGVDKDGNLTEISSLIDRAKAIVIKSDIDRNLMRRVFEYAQMKRKPIICKIRDRVLNDDGVVNDTENAFYLGLRTRHPLGERIGVATIREMSRYFNVPTLLQGVTDIDALNLVVDAKKSGAPLYLEVSIHHLIFDDTIYYSFNNYSKIEPPFQSKEAKEYLLQLLKDGQIDMVTSLHHKVSESEKSGSFMDSQYGVIGLDGILSIYYSTLVDGGLIDIERLQDITSRNQKRFLGVKNSKKVVFDLSQTTKIEDSRSLYYGKTFQGRVESIQ